MWAFVVDNKAAVTEDAYGSASIVLAHIVYLAVFRCGSFDHENLK